MKKLIVLTLIAMLAAPALSFAAAKAEEDPFEEQPQKAAPVKKNKKKNTKEIEAKASIEAPEPEIPSAMSEAQLKQLSQIMAQIPLAKAQLELERIEASRIENQKKMNEALAPSPEMLNPEPEPAPISRSFPMPGGNPQVVSIFGGSKKALEATLKFPNGVIYEVTKGMMLEGGYVVANVSGNGVVLEKNGFRLNMPISQGEAKGKPWDDGQEQGQQIGSPTTQPPAPGDPNQQKEKKSTARKGS